MGMEMQVTGMDDISRMLETLQDKAGGVAARGLYDGAKVMVKEVNNQASKIKTSPFQYAKGGDRRNPSPEEKAILIEHGAGVAKFDKNGSEVQTSIGYNSTGYADVSWNHMASSARTNYKAVHIKGRNSNSSSLLKAVGMGKGGQNQKPIGVIANAINSGTSFMVKQPFVRQAASKGKGPAEAAIVDTIDKLVNEITK